MKKILLLLVVSISLTTYAQTSKWGLSYDAEFITVKYDLSAFGYSSGEESITAHTLNLHYSFLSWASKFQIGPLVSLRTFSDQVDTYTDFLVGLDLGYNFTTNLAIVLDSYYVFGNDLDPILIKPAIEIGQRTAFVLGYTKYIYTNEAADLLGIEAAGPFIGLKYKF